MAELESVQFVDMPEIHKDDDLMVYSRQLIHHHIPAFVIRSGETGVGNFRASDLHDHNSARILRATQILLKDMTLIADPIDFTGLGQERIGVLHVDIDNPDWPTDPFVHTTISGAGNVLVAAAGRKPILACSDKYRPAYKNARSEANHPHVQLLKRQADPDLVHPTFYKTYVKGGDSIVMKESGKQSVWHRFDTDTVKGKRKVRVNVIRRKDILKEYVTIIPSDVHVHPEQAA